MLGQSGPGSNGNEVVLHMHQISKTGALPQDTAGIKLKTPIFGSEWGRFPSREYNQFIQSPTDRAVMFLV